jgi:hypothetical protein
VNIFCCGEVRTSLYCPDCGKALADTPILSLLAHLRAVAKSRRSEAARLRREATYRGKQGKADVEAEFLDGASRVDRVAEKWEAWAAAVEALMNPSREGG